MSLVVLSGPSIGAATRVIEQKVVQVNKKLCNMNKKLFK